MSVHRGINARARARTAGQYPPGPPSSGVYAERDALSARLAELEARLAVAERDVGRIDAIEAEMRSGGRINIDFCYGRAAGSGPTVRAAVDEAIRQGAGNGGEA